MVGKATRKIPPGSINPDGRQMRRFEREFFAALLEVFRESRRRIMRGVTRDSVYDILQRVNSPQLLDKLNAVVGEHLSRIVEAGVSFGQEQIEREVLGTIKAVDPSALINIPSALITIDWHLVNTRALEWLSRYKFDLLSKLTQTNIRLIQTEIETFISSPNMSIRQLGQRLESLWSQNRAQMIATTEVTRVYAEGNTTAWRESGVIERRRWNTANDELVCPICGPLNQSVVDIDEPFPNGIDNPPAHPRCRCWVTPVVGI